MAQSGPGMVDMLMKRMETWNSTQDKMVAFHTTNDQRVIAERQQRHRLLEIKFMFYFVLSFPSPPGI